MPENNAADGSVDAPDLLFVPLFRTVNKFFFANCQIAEVPRVGVVRPMSINDDSGVCPAFVAGIGARNFNLEIKEKHRWVLGNKSVYVYIVLAFQSERSFGCQRG